LSHLITWLQNQAEQSQQEQQHHHQQQHQQQWPKRNCNNHCHSNNNNSNNYQDNIPIPVTTVIMMMEVGTSSPFFVLVTPDQYQAYHFSSVAVDDFAMVALQLQLQGSP
jgi:hypothetical protein